MFSMKNDYPKSLADPSIRQERIRLLKKRHILPLTTLVNDIRKERGLRAEVPYFDPLDGGIQARCLFVLEAPGPKAIESGFVSRNNSDETAKNFFRFNKEVGLQRKKTIIWNIVPWYLGSGERIQPAKSADIKAGFPYLVQLIHKLPKPKVIILLGNKAQRTKKELQGHWKGPIVDCYHPSPSCVNRDRARIEKSITNTLREAKNIVMNA